MARNQTWRGDRRRTHRRAESRTSNETADAGNCARAYRLSDQDVAAIAARHPSTRPRPDPVSATAAIGEPDEPPIAINSTGDTPADDPVAPLWATLEAASENGITVRELIDSTGMGRTWISSRLRELAAAGRVIQIARGRWIIATAHTKTSTSEMSADPCVPPPASARAERPPRQAANLHSRTTIHATSDLEGYVRGIVDLAPPLTEAQRARLAALLRRSAAPAQARHPSRRATTHRTARRRRLDHQPGQAPRQTVDLPVAAREQHT